MAALEVPNVLEANQLVQLIHRVRRHIHVHGVALRLQVLVSGGQRGCRHAHPQGRVDRDIERSEEHTSELQSLMRISYAVFCLKKKKKFTKITTLQSATHIETMSNTTHTYTNTPIHC